jgi:UDP-N-acetylglucosamine--N-acetylmuramyl-(pentapeptide) pyrophosphoryl-undecaprenol N-acetylglucosamine transferase
MGYPAAIHEQNAFPGLANRILARTVNLVMLTFEEARQYLKTKTAVCTGLPVRRAILEADRNLARRQLAIPWGIFTLLVFGGSLGAHSINDAVEALLQECADMPWRVIWVTGPSDYEDYCPNIGRYADSRLKLEMHSYLNDIEVAMAASDLVIARSGASTLSELQILGLPAILVPYPHATDNHQEKNARALQESGAATVIADSEISGDRLCDEIRFLLADDRLHRMGRSMRAKARPEALGQMVDLVLEIAK